MPLPSRALTSIVAVFTLAGATLMLARAYATLDAAVAPHAATSCVTPTSPPPPRPVGAKMFAFEGDRP